MAIGAVPIFHKKKYQMKWLLEQYPFFIKKVSDEMAIGAVPIFHKKKYQMKWLLEQYPFFIKKSIRWNDYWSSTHFS